MTSKQGSILSIVFISLAIVMIFSNKIFNHKNIVAESSNQVDQSAQVNDNYPKSMFLVAYKHGEFVNSATCFVVSKNNEKYLLTNWHCITGLETDFKFKNEIPDSFAFFVKKNNVKTENIAFLDYWAQLSVKNQIIDVTASKFDDNLDVQVQTLNSNYDEKDSVYLYGFPKSYVGEDIDRFYDSPKKLSTNVAPSNIYEIIKEQTRYKEVPEYFNIIYWKKEMENGVSGSPVFSHTGEFVGIYSTKIEIVGLGVFGLYWNLNAINDLLDKGVEINIENLKLISKRAMINSKR